MSQSKNELQPALTQGLVYIVDGDKELVQRERVIVIPDCKEAAERIIAGTKERLAGVIVHYPEPDETNGAVTMLRTIQGAGINLGRSIQVIAPSRYVTTLAHQQPGVREEKAALLYEMLAGNIDGLFDPNELITQEEIAWCLENEVIKLMGHCEDNPRVLAWIKENPIGTRNINYRNLPGEFPPEIVSLILELRYRTLALASYYGLFDHSDLKQEMERQKEQVMLLIRNRQI